MVVDATEVVAVVETAVMIEVEMIEVEAIMIAVVAVVGIAAIKVIEGIKKVVEETIVEVDMVVSTLEEEEEDTQEVIEAEVLVTVDLEVVVEAISETDLCSLKSLQERLFL